MFIKFKAASSDGRELILNISLAPLEDKTGVVEGTLIAIEDLTDRVRLEEQLQQSDKLSSIGILAAGVAHEVNTPLTGISSYAQMLLQQVPDTDPDITCSRRFIGRHRGLRRSSITFSISRESATPDLCP
jgi:nitrogen-specific signal transduction histidine kinase